MKRIFYSIFLVGILMIFAKNIYTPEIKIVRNEETIIPIEQTIPDELINIDNLDLLFYDGEYAVFTTSREMKNQRMVGPNNETTDIYVYKTGTGIVFQPKINLCEGVISSAVYDGVNLYYTVYYPYAGKAAVIMDDGGLINEYTVYETEYEPASRYDNPLEIGSDGDTCYFKQSDDNTGCDIYIINGQLYEKFTGWHMQSDSGNYIFDLIVHDIKNVEKYKYDYGTVHIDYAGGDASVEIMKDDEHISWNRYHYWPGDMYLITGESIFSLEAESPANRYKTLYISMDKGILKERIDSYSPFGFTTNGKDMTVVYSNDGSFQKTDLITVNGYKVTVTSVAISPDKMLVGNNNVLFLIKENGINRIFTLK